jgi:FkbM family methyltransferase
MAWFRLVHFCALALYRVGLRFEFPAIRLRADGAKHPLLLRPGTSDYDVFKKIFVENEYAPLEDIEEPKLIVDCGANVGYSAAYFLSRFPTARVIALEPDPDNAEMCRKNLEPYGDRSTLLVRAVWSRPGTLTLLRFGALGDMGEHGVQVCESVPDRAEWPEHVHRGRNPPVPSGDVEALDLSSIVQLRGDQPVDILKMDIEKAELVVFRAKDLSWLSRIKNIVIELHGSEARNVFLDAVRDYNCRMLESGELTFCLGMTTGHTAHATG